MSNMSPSSRESSRDRSESRMVKHSHSFSESGRISVPMWDSSDPDRAPPPLPLNPGASNSPITKPHVSSTIEKAAALIASRAIENAPSAYTSNPPPGASPERSIMRPHHRRMQTIQTGSVGRLSDSLERRSPDKGLSRSKLSDFEDFRSSRSLDRSPIRNGAESPTPSQRIPLVKGNKSPQDENTPPSNMLALQSIRNRQDAESPPLNDITNGMPNMPNIRSTLSLDSLSTQILNITSIATNLQREMASLSRRSKDNASDLIGLKEATNARDEDIRKSLRDLVAGLERSTSMEARMLGGPLGIPEASRSTPNLAQYADSQNQDTPTPKQHFILPRIASPSLFDRDITASPSVVSVDGAASIALLEKVLREMATKDGQDKIMTTLEAVKAHGLTKTTQAVMHSAQPGIDPSTMQKLEEILVFMKDMKADSGSKALVRSLGENGRAPSQIDLYLDGDLKSGPVTKVRIDDDRRVSGISNNGADSLSEDIVKMLKGIKQSTSHNGGLTNETKALIRELRGEVLGMGREIAKKLEEVETNTSSEQSQVQAVSPEEVNNIVGQGLADLKAYMDHAVEEIQRHATESTQSVINMKDFANAVRAVFAESPLSKEQPRDLAAEREEILGAVKEAWEDCKPEIALEHFGLERDEILETLKEGLQSYQPQQSQNEITGATYDQVLDAVQKGLAEFQIPQIQPEAGPTRQEILETIQDCLENVQFPAAPSVPQIQQSDLSRDDIFDAVREGLSSHAQAREVDLSKDDVVSAVRDGLSTHSHFTKEVEFNRDDLFDAIRNCLEGENNPLGGMGERVVEAMHEFLGSMKTEFQQYSAANGRDTEQVLDALKDGLEELRAEVESYVDRAADVTGKDEIVDTVKAGFAAMQVDMDKGFANRMQQAPNTPELLDAMEKEFEHLRDSISRTLNRDSSPSDKEEILDAIRDLSDDRQSSLSTNSNNEDIARLVKEELEHLRVTLAGALLKSGASIDRDEVIDAIREGLENTRSMPKAEGNESILSNTSELLDAFQEGVDGIRADMEKLMNKQPDMSSSYEILDTLKSGIEEIRADISRLSERYADSSDADTIRGREIMLHDEHSISSEIESLKVMITQLRMKVEAMDSMPARAPTPPPVQMPEVIIPSEMRVHKDDLAELHSAIREVHDTVHNHASREISIPEVPMPVGAAMKEDTDAIETLLRNVKAQLDDIVMPDVDSMAKTSHLESVELLLSEVKKSVEESVSKPSENHHKEDFTIIELLLKDVQASIEDLQGKVGGFSDDDESKLTKTDLQVLESICLETKERLDNCSLPTADNLATKDDIIEMKESLVAFREQFESDNDLTAQAFEARKIEHGGLATKIDDVKTVISEIHEELVAKLNGSEEGIVELAKVLGMHHDSMESYATAVSVAELTDLVRKGFETHLETSTFSKADMDERDVTMFGKHDELSAELKIKIDDRFNELMTKYDDAQISTEAKLGAFEDRDRAQQETTSTVKVVVEDLKSLMETLGTNVSETCERMSDDARTVFEKVDEANSKIGDLQSVNVQEHSLTREEVVKAVQAAGRIEGTLQENHPAILAAIEKVLGIVGLHYEHSQQQTETFKTATEEIKTGVDSLPKVMQPLLPAIDMIAHEAPSTIDVPTQREYDDTEVHNKLDELLTHATSQEMHSKLNELLSRSASDTDVHSKLNELLSRPNSAEEVHLKLDELLSRPSTQEEVHLKLDELLARESADIDLHSKLNDILNAANSSRDLFVSIDSQHRDVQESLTGLSKLDNIHDQVRFTAEEISAMVATQTRLMAEHHQSRAEEAREAAVALEKRVAQKERVEAEVVSLTQEKNAIADSMAALRREQEELIVQTKHLTREVAKLETALSIRQEEMRDMNARAEALERRVLEGVMNHARSMKFAKPASKKKKISPAERDASMSLKRVPSTSSNATTKASLPRGEGSTIGSAIGMALKKKKTLGVPNNVTTTSRASGVERRILSTSNVTGNRGADANRALVLAPANTSGLVSLKRSHSVKSNPSSYLRGRKPSWNGPESLLDKENHVGGDNEEDRHEHEEVSDGETERKTSYTGTYTDSMAYGTGSSLSRNSRNSMRTASYASSIGGTLNGHNESILEEDEDAEHDDEEDDISDEEVSDLEEEDSSNHALVRVEPLRKKASHSSDTQMVLREAEDQLADLPHRPEGRKRGGKFSPPSDSGIGTELPSDRSTLSTRS